MTSSETQPVTYLTTDESWAALSSVSLGRLVTVAAGEPEIFPVNFVVQRRTILIRSGEGTKLLTAVMHPLVAFEADDHNVENGWSVVVKGEATVLAGAGEIDEADRAQVLPWTATPKSRFIRVRPREISGRRFDFGAEPSPLLDFG